MTPSNSFASSAAARRQLRQALRNRRAALSAAESASAVRRIVGHICATPWLQSARPIGLYAATGSEVPTASLIALAHRRRCRVYLPRILDYRQHRMTFVRVGDRPQRRNRHGIAEPAIGQVISARVLSVVFVPVVGFDCFGTRLGSGAGYYDRLFSFRRDRPASGPLLVGLAFSCQQLPRIERDAHDVPLDALVSELGILRFTAKEDHDHESLAP